ncbi:LOW QUALITY PROTEIN: bifunctional glutamate/proline--tRNA ligase-like, partial [Homalodisca vitripennis]
MPVANLLEKQVFSASKTNPPLGELAVLKLIGNEKISVEWTNTQGSSSLTVSPDVVLETSTDIYRFLAKSFPELSLYGTTLLEQVEVDHWLSFCIGPMSCTQEFVDSILYLDKVLTSVTYLVANKLTIADLCVWATLYDSAQWLALKLNGKTPKNVLRWMNLVEGQKFVQQMLCDLPEEAKMKKVQGKGRASQEKTRKEEGKFVDLPGAEMGKVVVRFPPEASGYLHIGHAKAALLNQYYQEAFQGKLVFRFDDTNPAKEKVDFEKVILEDVELLQIKPDVFTHTSNYFDLMLGYCEQLLKQGKAYVDDTDPETMKAEREQRTKSKNWDNSVEKNMKMWEEMKAGTEYGQKCCVRARIDMSSANGCMRDPTIYRCKNEPHPRTGDKYKVYPTYDFACPIVDSVEGVTHCLRTMEYHDRDDQFYWFIEQLGLRRPHIWEYSRLNMTNTVLSKRKLTWFVDEGYVDGWDDPRFPTVRGILRRGMTVEGLKQFIVGQGSSRSVVVMEWDKIWAFNKKVIDPIAPRYTALDGKDTVPVLLSGVSEERLTVPKHPKNPEVGDKTIWVGPRILIDLEDAKTLKEGENTTFINWGNLKIKKIIKAGDSVTSVEAEPNLSDKDYKKTLKLTWLADTAQAPFIPCICVYFDHIISKPVLAKDEDFKQYIGHNTKTEVVMLGDPELVNVKKSEIIQLQRRGFFICDSPYQPPSLHTGRASPIVLFSIPDGHTKENPTAGVPKKQQISEKEKVSTAKGKAVEKSPSEEVSPGLPTDPVVVDQQIQAQGDKVRKLKAEKAAKAVIDTEVKKLLSLKELKASLESKKTTDKPGGGDANSLSQQIAAQGEKVRQLKSAKAAKDVVTSEVNTLLTLKAEYKKLTGQDWSVQPQKPAEIDNKDVEALNQSIVSQGNKVRQLKSEKAPKDVINAEVQQLLELKKEYKKSTGTEWKPQETVSAPSKQNSTAENSGGELVAKIVSDITAQGDAVRTLKSKKADKATVDKEVKVLLELKKKFKEATGQDYSPEVAQKVLGTQGNVGKNSKSSGTIEETLPPEAQKKKPATKENIVEVNTMAGDQTAEQQQLTARVNQQGDVVRQLKSSGADKAAVDEAVALLLTLKEEYKKVTGTEFPTAKRAATTKKEKQPPAEKPKKEKAKEKTPEVDESGAAGGLKKQTRLGLEAKKEENLPDWYSQVITKGELIEYYDVSGCYILRPWAFTIWEQIRDWLDLRFKQLGVRNCYFPMFVSRNALEKEKTHIADFAPEVAWVTKSGESDLAEPIAIRPTSETVMYPAYAKWIQSYRDLPLKLNQWNNVVRWEFKHPQPFLRTREFLWQEGHTAYASQKDAQEEVYQILELYAGVYVDLLAIPVIKGRKTEKEQFAGADFTTTVEAFISASGRAIQGATSHHLGQNFSKMFEIIYEDPDPDTQEKQFVFQNSWGLTTRTIGVMIMVHADNKGLVLPPRVAAVQVVIVMCGVTVNLKEAERKALLSTCQDLEAKLSAADIRVQGDYRDNYSPGWKFNHWGAQ